LGSRIIRYVRDGRTDRQTDRRTDKATLIPIAYGRGRNNYAQMSYTHMTNILHLRLVVSANSLERPCSELRYVRRNYILSLAINSFVSVIPTKQRHSLMTPGEIVQKKFQWVNGFSGFLYKPFPVRQRNFC